MGAGAAGSLTGAAELFRFWVFPDCTFLDISSVPGGYGGVFGPFFVCGLGEEDFCSLTPEQVKAYKKEFHCAEILIGATGNTPITMKVQPKAAGSPGQEKSRNDPPGRE